MNSVTCFLDAYEQTYIHFAKYELFLIILTALPKFIITRRNADTNCLQAHDLHTNYAQLHDEIDTAAAQWLRCCATNRKVAGSIPSGII